MSTKTDALDGVHVEAPITHLTQLVTNRRTQLHRRACELWPSAGSQEEIDAHFRAMPEHYWQRVSEQELVGDLAAVHAFLGRLDSVDQSSPHVAVVWQHFTDQGFTRVRVCTWDRQGLLATVVAALGSMRMNIIRAGVYTREDNVVLDVFDVCEEHGGHIAEKGRFDSIAFLIEGALSDPPRFASVWSAQFHKIMSKPASVVPVVGFDLNGSHRCTIIQVEASDRIGLLYDILSALSQCGLNVEQAFLNTDDGVAMDAFHVYRNLVGKVTAEAELKAIRETVISAVMN